MADQLSGSANDDQSTKATAGENQAESGVEKLVNAEQATGKTTRVSSLEDLPGRRLYNPLSKFASYNYQITLYMITPDAYDAFILSGRRNINVLTGPSNSGAGAYVIAQSGGVNSKTSQRAPGFGLDVYIDDLVITQQINGAASQSATNISDVKFTIIEPYGFSFISNLRRTADALAEYSDKMGNNKSKNPIRQFYVLAIRFYGYDVHGNIVTEYEHPDGSVQQSQDGFFETFYDILITSVKFKLASSSGVKYSVEARTTAPMAAYGTRRGVLNNTSPIQASTVLDALTGTNGLLTRMNKEQENLVADRTIKEPNRFSVEFLGDSSALQNASIVSPADLDKYRWSGSGTQNSSQVNDATAATTVPNPTKRQITFAAGTPILSAIQQIIVQSSYLEDALKLVYTTSLQPDSNKKDRPITENNSNTRIRWYTISARLSNPRYDDKINDFAYDILYIIQPYETPVVRSLYSNRGINYYGPHKRYEYWFTGKNSEVLAYENTFDALYQNTVLRSPDTKLFEDERTSLGDNSNSTPVVPGQRQPRARMGKLDVGLEAQNAFVTDMYDPGALVTFKATILGDPDYLIQEQSSSLDVLYSKFYGPNGFTINPNGGQVFIEIDFKEGVDYDHKTGLFSINEQIRLFDYPQKLKELIKGNSYLLHQLRHRFQNGMFRQELEGVIATFGGATEEQGVGREAERQDSSSAPSPKGTNTTVSTGLRPDPLPSSSSPSGNPEPAPSGVGAVPGSQQPSVEFSTTTAQVSGGQSADDDGKPPVGLSVSGSENSKNREATEFNTFTVFR